MYLVTWSSTCKSVSPLRLRYHSSPHSNFQFTRTRTRLVFHSRESWRRCAPLERRKSFIDCCTRELLPDEFKTYSWHWRPLPIFMSTTAINSINAHITVLNVNKAQKTDIEPNKHNLCHLEHRIILPIYWQAAVPILLPVLCKYDISYLLKCLTTLMLNAARCLMKKLPVKLFNAYIANLTTKPVRLTKLMIVASASKTPAFILPCMLMAPYAAVIPASKDTLRKNIRLHGKHPPQTCWASRQSCQHTYRSQRLRQTFARLTSVSILSLHLNVPLTATNSFTFYPTWSLRESRMMVFQSDTTTERTQ